MFPKLSFPQNLNCSIRALASLCITRRRITIISYFPDSTQTRAWDLVRSWKRCLSRNNNTTEDWDWNRAINKRIKKVMKNKKHESFRDFADCLLGSSPTEEARTIKSITKAKKGYQTKHKVDGKSLAPDVMTQYIQETSQAPRSHNTVLESFIVTQALCAEIDHARARGPLNKAPGTDLVIGELLRAASGTHGRFLAEM